MTPIKIGYSLSLSGANKEFGQATLLSHKLWEENVNKNGGLLGRQVTMQCIDDKSSANDALKIYNHLLDVEKVDLVIGGYGSIPNSTVAPFMVERQKFFISLMNKSTGYSNCFSMIPVGIKMEAGLTDSFFKNLSRNSSVALIAADLECTRNIVAGAKENILKNSHHSIFEYNYSLESCDFIHLAKEIKSMNPDAVYIAAYASDSLGIIKAINEVGFYPENMGASVIRPFSLKKMDFELDNVMEQYFSRTPSTESEMLDYYIAPMAYAQLQILEEAIKRTNSLNDLSLIHFAQEAVFKTVIGEFKFDKNGECITSEMLNLNYQNNMNYLKGSLEGSDFLHY